MFKILLSMVLFISGAAVVHAQGFAQLLGNGQISVDEIVDLTAVLEGFQKKPYDEAAFNDLHARSLKVFQPGRILPPKYLEEFQNSSAGTIGTGEAEIFQYYLVNRAVGDDQKEWDSYIAQIKLGFDRSGRVVDLRWDKPMRIADKTISTEQLEIFLDYVRQKNFHGMRFKGEDVFKNGRALPSGYKALFAPYAKEPKDGLERYEFYSYADPAGHRAAQVNLSVNAEGKVERFVGIEAW